MRGPAGGQLPARHVFRRQSRRPSSRKRATREDALIGASVDDATIPLLDGLQAERPTTI